MIGPSIFRAIPFVVGAALLSVMVHVLTILAMPSVAARTGAMLLSARAGENGFEVLAPARPGGAATPFADPAMAFAVCAFDLSEGPWRIRATPGETFTSLVVLGPTGDVVHGLTDKVAVRRSIDVVLATEAQLRRMDAPDPEDRAAQEVRLRIGAARGIVMLRGLAARETDAATTMEGLRRAQCGPAGDL
jgi:uncharacterized membrane protein